MHQPNISCTLVIGRVDIKPKEWFRSAVWLYKKRMRLMVALVVGCWYLGSLPASLDAADAANTANTATNSTFANLSFEQLAQIQIITASKRLESVADTPAAVFVLTGEDIHRMGVTSLPEALRYVPGVEVAMIDSSRWAVSARGFNGQFANQLLVMIDGRSIYNPSFGGVYWVGQDYLLDDIDRIEVGARARGSAMGRQCRQWCDQHPDQECQRHSGRAVERRRRQLQRSHLRLTLWLQDLGPDICPRVYEVRPVWADSACIRGDTPDNWNRLQGGFRLDSQPDESATFTLQGDVHRADQRFGDTFPSFTAPGGVSTETYWSPDLLLNLLGRWTRNFSADSTMTAQVYYDYEENSTRILNQRLHTLDADLHHHFGLGERQLITWGVGYRATLDTISPTRVMRVPGREQANDQLFSLFMQDEIALVREKLFLTLGPKIEHNDYTGLELSPSARMRWQPTERQTVWGAVSRGVVTPGHLTGGMQYDVRVVPPGALVQIQGRSAFVEELLAYEIGYRIQPVERVSVDVAAFYSDYSHLQSLRTGAVIPGTPPIVPVFLANQIEGHTDGVELALGWQALDHWRLQGTYTWFESDVAAGSLGRGDGGASPAYRVGLRSTVDFGKHWEWDTGLRFVDELKTGNVPSYLELDIRVAWKPNKHWEVALVGQSLLQDSHYEFPRGLSSLMSEVPRSVYGKITWKF